MQTLWDLQRSIEHGWNHLNSDGPEPRHREDSKPEAGQPPFAANELIIAVERTLDLLDQGIVRVASDWGTRTKHAPHQSDWATNEWIKKAILLSFGLRKSRIIGVDSATPERGAVAFDKVPLKFAGWTADEFRDAKLRVAPGAIVRAGAHLGKGVLLMPSFINIGARVDANTMVDTWASIGSGAQIGSNCHISAGAGIGGVLEPVQARPTIIEDDCFIGARSEIVEGVLVGRGSVIGMGVFITASTKIIDRTSGQTHVGEIPPYSVVVPGCLPGTDLPNGEPGPGLACAVIVKRVDARTRSKTAVNDLLRA